MWVVIIIMTLRAYGCPIPAIVAAFGRDERTVAAWDTKVGQHTKQVQEDIVCQGNVDLGQVQADELYGKTQGGKLWIATAMSVATRLFVWAAVSPIRDSGLLTVVMEKVRAAARLGQPILFAVDGFSAYITVILHTFRDTRHTGKRGRPRNVIWSDIHLVQVIKQRSGYALKTVKHRLVHGCMDQAKQIIARTQRGLGTINTAYVERLNATLRGWLPAALTRRSRTPMTLAEHLEASVFWVMGVYNFCRVHSSLGVSPAMAAGLTDHVWIIQEFLFYRKT